MKPLVAAVAHRAERTMRISRKRRNQSRPWAGGTQRVAGVVFVAFAVAILVLAPFACTRAQETGLPAGELPAQSRIINTHEIPEVRLVVVARGLSHPWSLAFLPGGDMLITERGGRLRMVRDGALVAEPLSGLPTDIDASDFSGLMEVVVHPDFAAHLTFLPAGKYGLELMANLDDVPPAGATLIVGAPKHQGGSGGPARVFAVS